MFPLFPVTHARYFWAIDKELETIVLPNGLMELTWCQNIFIFRHSKINLRYRSNLNSGSWGQSKNSSNFLL